MNSELESIRQQISNKILERIEAIDKDIESAQSVGPNLQQMRDLIGRFRLLRVAYQTSLAIVNEVFDASSK